MKKFKKSKKVKLVEPIDERQVQIIQKALVYGFLFLFVCIFIAMVHRFITTKTVGWELFGVIGSCVVVLISLRSMGYKEYKERPFPTGSTKVEKRIRRKKYAADCLYFGIVFAVMDIISVVSGDEGEVVFYRIARDILPNSGRAASILVTGIFRFIFSFSLFFIVSYLIGEFYLVKRYKYSTEQLHTDEEE